MKGFYRQNGESGLFHARSPFFTRLQRSLLVELPYLVMTRIILDWHVETTIRLGVKSCFRYVGLAQATPFKQF